MRLCHAVPMLRGACVPCHASVPCCACAAWCLCAMLCLCCVVPWLDLSHKDGTRILFTSLSAAGKAAGEWEGGIDGHGGGGGLMKMFLSCLWWLPSLE